MAEKIRDFTIDDIKFSVFNEIYSDKVTKVWIGQYRDGKIKRNGRTFEFETITHVYNVLSEDKEWKFKRGLDYLIFYHLNNYKKNGLFASDLATKIYHEKNGDNTKSIKYYLKKLHNYGMIKDVATGVILDNNVKKLFEEMKKEISKFPMIPISKNML